MSDPIETFNIVVTSDEWKYIFRYVNIMNEKTTVVINEKTYYVKLISMGPYTWDRRGMR